MVFNFAGNCRELQGISTVWSIFSTLFSTWQQTELAGSTAATGLKDNCSVGTDVTQWSQCCTLDSVLINLLPIAVTAGVKRNIWPLLLCALEDISAISHVGKCEHLDVSV